MDVTSGRYYFVFSYTLSTNDRVDFIPQSWAYNDDAEVP